MAERETYTEAEVAAKLGVNRATLQKGVTSGTVPAPLIVGNRKLFPRAAVDAILRIGTRSGPIQTAALR